MRTYVYFFVFLHLEIPNAITELEIEHITEKATSPFHGEGLFKSEARGGLTPEDSFKPSKGNAE